MPLLQMTTRRWMIAVALVGIPIGLAARARQFERIARSYDAEAIRNFDTSQFVIKERDPDEPRPAAPTFAAFAFLPGVHLVNSVADPCRFCHLTAKGERHFALARQCRNAAWYPWLSVPPDPPPPN